MVKELNVQDVFPETTYFYIDDKTNAGFIIDPGAQPELIYDYIKTNGWKIEKILLTHGHMDHIGAVTFLQEKLQIPVFIHSDEEDYLKDGYLNLSSNYGAPLLVEGYSFLKDKEIIRLKENPDFYLQVIHAPGHTPGSLIFYNPDDKVAFIGDILFEHGVGLSHFPGGDKELLDDTIVNKVLSLPGDTMLYASHATPITVDSERKLLLG